MNAKDPRTDNRWRLAVRQLPNLVTVARVVLVVPTAWLLWHGQIVAALALIAIGGLSDAVDGELARRFDWRTRFGAIADPAADKLLIVVVFVVLAVQGHLPVWLLVVVVGRDLVIVSGALTYRFLFGELEMAPTLLSKVNTGLQIVVLLLVLVHLAGYEPAASIAGMVDPWGFVLVGLSSTVSGIQYVLVWSWRARDEHRARAAAASEDSE